MASIHPTATVSREAELADDAEIGPHCVLAGRVRLGPGVRLYGNVYLSGPVTIGARTQIYPFACLGFPAQDVKFKPGDPTAGVVVGEACLIREHATIHAATTDHTPTTIGDRVFMMVNSHVGHDCRVGDGAILINGAALGGHSQLGAGAILSAMVVIQQFTRIGRLAFFSGLTGASMDVPPFCLVALRNTLTGVNLVGMRRAKIAREEITAVRAAFRDVFRRALPRGDMLAILEERAKSSAAVGEMARFVAESKRSIAPGAGRPPKVLTAWMHATRRGTLPAESELEEGEEAPL